jgi:hypothetical protein
VIDLLKRYFKLKRDNNYYIGLILLELGIATIFWYLFFDAFEAWAFVITFLLCGWGFVLLWKSDNDYRFQIAKYKIMQLESEMQKNVAEMQNSKAEIDKTREKMERQETVFRRRKLALSRGRF